MPRPASRAARSQPASVLAAIESFLAASRLPVLQEPGELPFPLIPGQFELSEKAGALLIAVWDEARQLHRRAVAVQEDRPGRLTLTTERFGNKTGTLVLYDDSKPASAPLRKQAERHHFRDQLRAMIRKQFPSWRLLDLSADPDLEHSLSANYPRALLRQGQQGVAIVGAPPGPAEPAHALTYGLIWLDYLRRREPELQIHVLALFLPQQALTAAALRLRHLTGATFRLFAYTHEMDLADCGNLHTQLLPAQPHRISLLHPEVDVTPAGSHRFRGLDVPQDSLAHLEDFERLRSPDTMDRLNPLYTRHPEGWLESQVRRNLSTVDAMLQPSPVYGQVVSVAGVERGIADLLAIGYDGRLTVMEMKATEDIHLPLQALDYWMRIAHHAAQGDFPRCNYFPGLPVQAQPPRLLLVAPALSFHPTTETILRFFSSNLTVERIGLALEWRQMVRVLFRLRGADRPA
ncbi:MAG TPA: hypothetical protein VFQ91_03470 [Bryobacteraceae bacterium]|nr:hypothetical protein [Bryobacteraceae bacterium]